MIKDNLCKSALIGLGLTILGSLFMGWLKVSPFRPEQPIVPIPLQLLKIWIVTSVAVFLPRFLHDLLKEIAKKKK